jgi:hypothetical protein
MHDVPVNELKDNLTPVVFHRYPMLVGRVPWRDVYVKCMYSRLLSCPMVVGRVPLSLTFSKYRIDKLDIDPMVLGMEPTIFKFKSHMCCKAFQTYPKSNCEINEA